MKRQAIVRLFACLVVLAASSAAFAQPGKYARDPKQAIDEDYTKKIREYTTAPYFNSPLTDYLPASKTVPTPKAVLGDVSGAPGILPYTAQVHEYMRMLEKAAPGRVKVFSIGKSEEGREMIAVAISSELNMQKFEENRARLARLADPRDPKAPGAILGEADADRLVEASVPVYYITGTIHSPETGSPTALMELAYRLVVDDAPYIKTIRNNVVTLITPVVETDGRDRQVDIYKWHLAHPKDNWPQLAYWGHYVMHDNNRDAMGATLALTRNVINATINFKVQVLHDLHESVAYLYDNTVGDGPYNAWVDPIVTDEWQLLGWNNMSELTKFGMPGAFTHGTFDTWSPGYLMFIGAMHNGISRLYETFGNAGSDTVERRLGPSDTSRTWYRQNPALPIAKWSQRNNNNYTETGLLTALSYFSGNTKLFLKNFYLKSRRSVEKPKNEGPAAYVFPADDPRPGAQAELLRILERQGVEISRATDAFTVTVPAKRRPQPTTPPTSSASSSIGQGASFADPDQGRSSPVGSGLQAGTTAEDDSDQQPDQKPAQKPTTETRTFPAGSYLVRMDQPYSRIADALLDYQYWSPNDPQKQPYDDTGWTFPELFNVQAVRVSDVKALDAKVEKISGDVRAPGATNGTGQIFLVNHDADPSLIALRYRLKNATFDTTEEPFDAAGRKFNRGSFVIRNVANADLDAALKDLGLQAWAVASAPDVKTHAVKTPRIAYVHTWQGTQDEGWWRMEFDRLKVPYDYISTQVLAKDANLNAKYDVIVFPPAGRPPQSVVNGMPMWGNPLPWKTTELTPNIGKIDSTDDMRPGLGFTGVMNLDAFIRKGGLLITTDDTSDLAVTYGLTQGVSVQRATGLKAPGTIVRAKFVDGASPIAYGYADDLSVYISEAFTLGVTSGASGRGNRVPLAGASDRPTGRGTVDDPDVPQGRPIADKPQEEPRVEPWQYVIPNEEQLRNGINIIPPQQRPRVILRFGDSRDLLVSGLLEGGNSIAQRPAVVDVPHDKGHVLLFSPNPMWRGETQGSYGMVFNAILNFDNLDAGRKVDPR